MNDAGGFRSIPFEILGLGLSPSPRLECSRMWLPLLALTCVQFLFGGLPVASKIVLTAMPPTSIVLLRTAVAALAFAAILAVQRRRKLNEATLKSFGLKTHLTLVLFAFLGICANQLTLFFALRYTTATAAAITVPSISIFTLSISLFLGLEKFGWLKILNVLLGASGIFFLFLPYLAGTFRPENLIGNLLCVVSAFSYALFLVFSKKTISKVGSIPFSFLFFFYGTLLNGLAFFILPGATTTTFPPLAELPPNFFFALFFLIFGSTVLSYFLNIWALARLVPSAVGGFVCLQTLVGVSAARFFLAEAIPREYYVAAGFILMGVLLVSVQSYRDAQIPQKSMPH